MDIEDRIGVSTHSLPGVDIWEGIKRVAEAGFKVFELVPATYQAVVGLPRLRNAGVWPRDCSAEDRKRLKDALGVFKEVTIHAPHVGINIASLNPGVREECKRQYHECIQLGIDLGAKIVTFHPGGQTDWMQGCEEEIAQYNTEFGKEAIKVAEKYDLKLGYEVLGSFEQMRKPIDEVGSARFGLNLDCSHAAKSVAPCTPEKATAEVLRFIDYFGEKIVEVHVHGVFAWWAGRVNGFDGHQNFSRNNILDYAVIMKKLKQLDYQGPFVFEIQSRDVATILKDSQEAKELLIKYWQ